MRRRTNTEALHVDTVELDHGVSARIHLNPSTGTFSTSVSGHGRLEGKDLAELRAKVKALTITPPHTEYTWVPAIVIRHSVDAEDADRYSYSYRNDETRTTATLTFKRVYYGRKTRGSKVYEAAWPKEGQEDDPQQRHVGARETEEKPDLSKPLPQAVAESGYGYSRRREFMVLPYTEERWAKLQKFNADLRAEAQRVHGLLTTEAALDVIDAVGLESKAKA